MIEIKKYVGQVMKILVTDRAKDGKALGHNKEYQQVLLEWNEHVMGKMFDVRIIKTGKHYLIGELLPESLAQAPIPHANRISYDFATQNPSIKTAPTGIRQRAGKNDSTLKSNNEPGSAKKNVNDSSESSGVSSNTKSNNASKSSSFYIYIFPLFILFACVVLFTFFPFLSYQ